MTAAAPNPIACFQETPLPLYKETNFKELSIGKIPADWVATRVTEIGAVVSGFGFSLDFQGRTSGKYSFVKVGDMNSTSKYVSTAENYVDEEALEALKAKAFPPNTLIFPKIGMAIYLNKYRLLKVWATFDNNVAGIIPKKVDPEFLYYYFKGFVDLKQSSSRTTAPSIRKTTLESLIMPLPPMAEQRAIVGILGVVDSAIELSNQVIAKTERLKRGLMQQLLTRGIGHKETKQTPIGTIPKDWDVVTLGAVCEQRNDMVQPTETGSYTFVGLEHISSGEIKVRNYSKDAFLKSSKFKFYSGDLLYGKLRPYLDKAALVDFDGICSTDLLVLKNKNDVSKEFLAYILHSKEFLDHAIATTSGTNHPRTSWKAISKFKFALPPIPEQQRIADTLLTVDKKLTVEGQERAKLERIKRGLMDLLLTGKVRIKVD